MRTVVIHGKVIEPISPRAQYPDADLWGCTHTQQQYEKHRKTLDDWTEWFDVHPVEPTTFPNGDFYAGIKALRPATWKWFKTLPADGRPLWLLEPHPEVPAARRFPYEEVRAAFPIEDEIAQPIPGGMFTCQVDALIAWAILRGYQHIVLHGHGVSRNTEHMYAHRGILYWCAVARERGIRVTIHAPSWYRAPIKAYGIEAGGGQPNEVQIPPRARIARKLRRPALPVTPRVRR